MWSELNHGRMPGGFGKLEALLVVSFLALLFQVFPSLSWGVLYVLDVRNWGRAAWMTLNVAFAAVLFAIRFGPDLVVRGKKNSKPNRRRRSVISKSQDETDWKSLSPKGQQALFKRMQEARRKQVM